MMVGVGVEVSVVVDGGVDVPVVVCVGVEVSDMVVEMWVVVPHSQQ
jgi:hypothetical protein